MEKKKYSTAGRTSCEDKEEKSGEQTAEEQLTECAAVWPSF